MGGESGTSHMGNTYYYYKCGNAKRHGKAHCDLKAIRKEPLERFVVDTAIKVIFNDEIIEQLIDLVMEAQQQENTRLPVLKEQLRDTEKRLANLLEAIEPVSYTHLAVGGCRTGCGRPAIPAGCGSAVPR